MTSDITRQGDDVNFRYLHTFCYLDNIHKNLAPIMTVVDAYHKSLEASKDQKGPDVDKAKMDLAVEVFNYNEQVLLGKATNIHSMISKILNDRYGKDTENGKTVICYTLSRLVKRRAGYSDPSLNVYKDIDQSSPALTLLKEYQRILDTCDIKSDDLPIKFMIFVYVIFPVVWFGIAAFVAYKHQDVD
ncbi:hypothetical protein RF11_07650 [Thelohanellus kitauei]|uniref:Uncharacterized protein n=1 Tax=Thelohanellus kitauei TaxID=669202 RepID=A0A0C2JDR5_THEKT|nr:hypothetical protein RF11_07650 [Thelohanellus kitauei]